MTIDDKTPGPRGVLPHHLRELRESGLSNETIVAAGIHSENSYSKLALLLNRKNYPKKWGPAIVYPFRDESGAVVLNRVKPDNPPSRNGRKAKYLGPSGQGVRAYVTTNVWAVAENPTQPLFVTEGEKKTLKAVQEGFLVIGLTGCDCWHKKRSSALIPDLDRFVWKGRRVFIVFDSDAADNPAIRENECLLAATLTNHGTAVKVVRLPESADGKKVGLDDFLVANDVDDFHQLVNAAEEAEPPDAGSILQHGGMLDPASEAQSFLGVLSRNAGDGVPTVRYWRGSFWGWRHGAYYMIHPDEIHAKLTCNLNRLYRMLAGGKIRDTLDQVRAQSLLSFATEPPCWLGEPPRPWSPQDVLATRNQLVHLPAFVTGEPEHSLPVTPQFFTTASLGYDFNLDAPKPEAWQSFLWTLWGDDTQSITALREWFGYCLTQDTSQQKILMLIGPSRSGKGVIARVLRGLIGEANAAGPTLASLATNFGLQPLIGKSLAIVSDARLSGKSDPAAVLERLLSISGEDALTIDRKNLEPITTRLPARLMILSNELPRFADASGAIAGRMILIRLTTSFLGKEDPTLTSRLLGELPSILLWAIAGWKSLHDRGHFFQPASGTELADELRDLASPIGRFVRERCVVGPACNVERKSLFIVYRAWAVEAGRNRIEDQAGFGRALRAAVPGLRDSNRRMDGGGRVRFYEGVGLAGDDVLEE